MRPVLYSICILPAITVFIIFIIFISAVLILHNTYGPACRLSPLPANLGRLIEKVRASQPSCSRCDAGRLAGRLAGWLQLAAAGCGWL